LQNTLYISEYTYQLIPCQVLSVQLSDNCNNPCLISNCKLPQVISRHNWVRNRVIFWIYSLKIAPRMKSILLRIAAKIHNCINFGHDCDCDCETGGRHACARMCVHACVCVNWIIYNRRWESTYSNSGYCWIDGCSFTDLHFIHWAFKHRTSSIRTRDYCDLYNCLRIFSTTISSLQGN